jgi:hypothetical protein
MANAIGIRCTPKEVFFAICRSDNGALELITVDSIIVPAALTIPEKLKFIRNTLLDVIDLYKITNACIRITEASAQQLNVERVSIEAVIQELFASSTIEKYYVGQISNITSRLSIPRADFLKIISGEIEYKPVRNFGTFKDANKKECILASISSLNL